MRTVTVTGCAGFIGSHLVERLLRTGHHVVGIDRRGPDDPEAGANLQAALGNPRFHFVQGELADLPLGDLLAGAEQVVHLAARPGTRDGWGPSFAGYVRDNIIATQHLLEAVVAAGVRRLVFASTSAVYGEAPLPLRETGPTRPVSPYGITKVAAEQLVRLYGRQRGLDWVILRYFSVYGPRQRPDMAFRRMMEAVKAGEEVVLYGTGDQTRDFTYVGDVVAATVRALKADDAAGHTINIGGGSPVTMNQALAELERLSGRPLQVRRVPGPPGEMEHTAADNRRARRLLDWKPRVGLDAGLSRQWIWLDLRRLGRLEHA